METSTLMPLFLFYHKECWKRNPRQRLFLLLFYFILLWNSTNENKSHEWIMFKNLDPKAWVI